MEYYGCIAGSLLRNTMTSMIEARLKTTPLSIRERAEQGIYNMLVSQSSSVRPVLLKILVGFFR